jgi:polyisoprenoid-binding protein YceI
MNSTLRMLSLAGLVSTATLSHAAFAAETYTLDPMHTQTIFTVNHLGYSTVTGNFHDIKGTVVLDKQKPANSAVEVTIGAATVDTGVAPRDADLRSEHFFNVDKFPTMTFKSTKVTTTGADKADVEGDLTILGVTKPLTLKVKFNRSAPDQMRANSNVVGFTGTGKLKRSEFGMTTYLPYLGDDIDITVNSEAIIQK